MKITRVPWGLAACLMLWVCTGCVNDPGVIRGQNSDGVQTADGIYQPGYHIQQISGFSDSWNCQSCGGYGCNSCLFGNSCYNPDWYPTHHHWYRYKPPRNLVYPPANQPGGVVVYPYYTLKGPDDFFFEG
ncbi:MAG: hypothetical protein IH899_13260 [Planctomycetes bacterium]|nr:hypothetical protein [Planctomycetota bacterium]